jgi:hypothetical protein
MKCGGNLQQRAQRLWQSKGKTLDQIPAKDKVCLVPFYTFPPPALRTQQCSLPHPDFCPFPTRSLMSLLLTFPSSVIFNLLYV